MAKKIKEKVLLAQARLCSFANDKEGADMVEWVAIIAVVVGIIVLLSPVARNQISNFFTNVFNRLRTISTGG